MRIEIIGGGPAGLYFALLAKRAFAGAHIRIHEQNPRGATFGFGVVFSDRALKFLQDDDPAIYRLIARHCETWPDIAIVHRGERIAIDGNGFSAIGRLALLELLYRECERQGIEIRFNAAIPDPARFAEADLLVGADGLNSTVREAVQAVFQPSVTPLSNKFVWYGTRQPFDSLTLTFRQNEHGAFVAHHYRYAPDMSTFIVECDAETWQKAGFAQMSDVQSRAYCETVFAPDLGGHDLISNKSIWRNFPVLENRVWQTGNTVLLGDALRTVHFSIGSGTRLAMEDAIALSRALEAEGGRVARALPRFEAERRPIVDKILSGALGSAQWYERFAERMHLDPLDFAYDYMTRSGRMDDARLRQIAPLFWSRWHARRADAGADR